MKSFVMFFLCAGIKPKTNFLTYCNEMPCLTQNFEQLQQIQSDQFADPNTVSLKVSKKLEMYKKRS